MLFVFVNYHAAFHIDICLIFVWCMYSCEHKMFFRSSDQSQMFFSCDQAALWMVQSVCLSVCPSVCHTFLTMFPSSHHPEIFRSYYQWQKWRSCKRSWSKVKVTEVNTQLSHFRIITPVWIHIWWWNDAQSLMLLRGEALLFFKVIRQTSRSCG